MGRQIGDAPGTDKTTGDWRRLDVSEGQDEKSSGPGARQAPIRGFPVTYSYTETAAEIATITPALVHDTRAAHQLLLAPDGHGNVMINWVFKRRGNAWFTTTTEYTELPWDQMRAIIGKWDSCIVVRAVPGGRLPRAVFEIVTNGGGRTTSHTGYRLWLGTEGNSAFLPAEPRRAAYRIEGGTVCRAKEPSRKRRERHARFRRADRMVRRCVRGC